jgi:hypothetical protein
MTSDLSERSDVKAAERSTFLDAHHETQCKSKLDAMQVLRNVMWITTQPIQQARMLDEEGEDRPLTMDEWGAVMRRSTLGVKPYQEYWTLVHEYAGLLPDTNPMPRVRAVRIDATVQEILEAVADMTIAQGPYAIEGSVYFEGLRKVADMFFVVATGS